MSRPSKNDYLMLIAKMLASRGTCDRRQVGCVIATRDGEIVGTGYNGSAPGAPHCDDVGHLLRNGRCVRTVHAEANAIAHIAKLGGTTKGCICYSTCRPCPSCALLLVSAGIELCLFLEPYHPGAEDDLPEEMYGGLAIRQYSPSVADGAITLSKKTEELRILHNCWTCKLSGPNSTKCDVMTSITSELALVRQVSHWLGTVGHVKHDGTVLEDSDGCPGWVYR